MFAIYKRELRSYFTTAVGYVFLAVIVALSGVAFSLLKPSCNGLPQFVRTAQKSPHVGNIKF